MSIILKHATTEFYQGFVQNQNRYNLGWKGADRIEHLFCRAENHTTIMLHGVTGAIRRQLVAR